jgi:hypothetical protein
MKRPPLNGSGSNVATRHRIGPSVVRLKVSENANDFFDNRPNCGLKLDRMSAHCCDRMDFDLAQRCDVHASRYACPDALIDFSRGRYGLIVHDGGASTIEISFCPWCGARVNPDPVWKGPGR